MITALIVNVFTKKVLIQLIDFEREAVKVDNFGNEDSNEQFIKKDTNLEEVQGL